MISITLYFSTFKRYSELIIHNTLNLNRYVNLSEVDKLIQDCRYYPDGTKRRLKAGQAIDKRRDANYQLVQAVLYKYNEHHNLSGVCSLSSHPPASTRIALFISYCLAHLCNN
jgi:hypothetical protein